MTATGTGFVSGTRLLWNGFARPTTVVSATELRATIFASDIGSAGVAEVTVVSPGPGGGITGSIELTIQSPAPTLSAATPPSITAGGAPFTLTLAGTGFVYNAVVRWNGADRPTTFVSARQIRATISALDIASTGTALVTVFNPTPGGGVSQPLGYPVNSPIPVLTSLSPSILTAGSSEVTLNVVGARFLPTSVVRLNGADRATTFVSAAHLRAQLSAQDLTTSGVSAVTVFNPEPGGGASQPLSFIVNSPIPVVTSLAPARTALGSAAFTMTVNGTGFVRDSVVQWNNTPRSTTFTSATRLTAAIAAADVAAAGTAQVTVTNPTPGGGISGGVAFGIDNPAPAVASLLPPGATVGGGALTLSVTGSGFVPSSVVRWNGAGRPTTFVSPTELRAAIPQSDLVAGAVTVTVLTPAPGGGVSSPATFTIANPAPVLAALSRTSESVGSPGFSLTVTGTGFLPTSVVRWNGIGRATQFVAGTQLAAAILDADLATAGTATVSVENPTPGGGASEGLTFLVTNPTPILASLSPSSANAGGPGITLTVNGSGFVPSSIVRWNGSERPTTFVDATQLTAAIAPEDFGPAGSTREVTVSTPGPGGGTSNARTFGVGPVPRFVFVAGRGDDGLASYRVDNATGELRSRGFAIDTYTYQGTDLPNAVAVNPDSQRPFVHTANTDGGAIATYRYDPSGRLRFMSHACTGAALACTGQPTALAVDPAGDLAYITNSAANTVAVFTIPPASDYVILDPVTGSPFATGTSPRGVAVDPLGRFLYVANATGNSISRYSIRQVSLDGGAPRGALTSLGAAVALIPSSGTTPTGVAIDPSGSFLYVITTTHVLAYRIESNGALSAIGSVAAGTTPSAVAVDPMGRFVYVANQGSNNLSGFRLNPVPVDDGGPPAGGLSVLPDSPFAMGAGTAPSGLAIDPSGRYLYVALGSAHEVAVFVIDPASGALTRAQAIRTRASPRGIAVAGGGTPATVTPRFAYTANSASDDVSAYSIDPSAGTLASAGRPAETGPTPAVITASPGGDLLGVLTQGSITSFAINAESGDLTLGGMAPMSGSSAAVFGVSADQTLYVTNASASSLDAYSVGGYYVSNFASASTGTGPTSVAVSPTGRFLYVTNGDANTVSAYSILQRYVFPPGTSAGTPSPIGSPLATGTRPSFIAVHPAGRFAYVLNQGSDSISVYNIHPSTGLLTSASSTPAGRGPTSMGISPSGRHAWVLNRADLTVQAFSIDLTTGALTAVENGILELGGDPVALTVDDAGRFVYVTSRLTEEMAVLAIDPATGLLGPVSVARLGSAPSGAAVVSSTE